jgi:hypothetical protein
VETGLAKIVQSGFGANLMVLPDPVFRVLRQHPQIVDRFKYTSSDKLDESQLAAFFGIAKVIVASAVKRSNAAVNSFVWGKDVVIAYVEPSPSRQDGSAFKTFVWESAPGTVGGYGVIRQDHPIATAKAEIVGVDFYYGQKVVNIDTAYLIKAAVA